MTPMTMMLRNMTLMRANMTVTIAKHKDDNGYHESYDANHGGDQMRNGDDDD